MSKTACGNFEIKGESLAQIAERLSEEYKREAERNPRYPLLSLGEVIEQYTNELENEELLKLAMEVEIHLKKEDVDTYFRLSEPTLQRMLKTVILGLQAIILESTEVQTPLNFD